MGLASLGRSLSKCKRADSFKIDQTASPLRFTALATVPRYASRAPAYRQSKRHDSISSDEEDIFRFFCFSSLYETRSNKQQDANEYAVTAVTQHAAVGSSSNSVALAMLWFKAIAILGNGRTCQWYSYEYSQSNTKESRTGT